MRMADGGDAADENPSGVTDNHNNHGPKLKPKYTDEEAADKFLPRDDFFPHMTWIYNNEIWTKNDEERFRLVHNEEARAQVEASKSSRYQDMSLWRVMIQLYDAIPIDLFRYGLKLDTSVLHKFAYKDVPNLNMAATTTRNLEILMCHPIFKADIAYLRWALQLAIYHRVAGHIFPVAAFPKDTHQRSSGQDPTIRFFKHMIESNPGGFTKGKMIIGDYYYHMLGYAGPAADHDMRRLGTLLEEQLTPARPANKEETQLFLLRTQDITAVTSALNSMQEYGCNKFAPCSEYWQRFKKHRADTTNRCPPCSPNTLCEWKEKCFLHELREKAVKAKLRRRGVPDFFFDVEQSGYVPRHVYSGKVSTEQRAIISGTIYPHDAEKLPPFVPSEDADMSDPYMGGL